MSNRILHWDGDVESLSENILYSLGYNKTDELISALQRPRIPLIEVEPTPEEYRFLLAAETHYWSGKFSNVPFRAGFRFAIGYFRHLQSKPVREC